MRRIDVIGIGIGIFTAGGVLYLILQWAGLDSVDAGIWSQAALVGGLIGWLLTYLFRAVTQNMTYNQQLQDYEDAVLQKRLEEMTPEELAKLQAEIEQERLATEEAGRSQTTNEP
jgi:hypothetical protein